MSQNVSALQTTTEYQDQKAAGCQCDDTSCISKENVENMTSDNHIGDIDCKNVTSPAVLINSFCSAELYKSMNGQSAASGSCRGEFSTEEGNKYSSAAEKYSTESEVSTLDFSGSSTPSEACSSRDERNGAKGWASECIMKPLELPPAKIVDSNILHSTLSENCVSVNPEVGYQDGSPSATGSLKRSYGNDHLKYGSPIRNMQNKQEPPSQSQTVADNDGTDDLVDVRVCDICGDVGREALLALCSKCTDGAEHIYCMRIKMDTVPDGDWMCEECMSTQEPKRQKQAEGEKSDHPANASYLEEVNRGLVKNHSRVEHTDEMRIKDSRKVSCLSGKRPGSDRDEGRVIKRRSLDGSMEQLKSSGCGGKTLLSGVSSIKLMKKEKYETRQVSSFNVQSAKKENEQATSPPGHRSLKHGSYREVKPALKSGAFEKGGHKLSKSGSGEKMLLTRVSSLKIKGKEAARQVPSVGHQSPKEVAEQRNSPQGHQSPRSQPQFRIGKLCKSKSINIPESNKEVRWQSKDIHADGSSKESADRPSNKKFPERKLFKSLSFNAVNSVPPNVSDAPSCPTKKDLRYGSGKGSTKKYGLGGVSTPRLGLQFSASDGMKVDTHRTKVGSDMTPHSLRNKVQEVKAIQANGNPNVKPCGPAVSQRQSCANTSVARSLAEPVSFSHPSDGSRSPGKNVSSCPDHKAKDYPQKSEVECASGAHKGQSVASDKVLPINSHPMKEMHEPPPGAVVFSGISAVPESEFVWKGAFKLEKSCKLPNECSGIQAHLSTCASSKVVDLVHKFCPKLLLKEAPRIGTWPIQFQRKLPTEQDIAVYFFAEDLESYSRSYKMILEGMVKYDLALEADLDGVQLLVFPSSLLPIRSQRWNALSFLWGVFRVKKVDNSIVHSPRMDVADLNQVAGSGDSMLLQSSGSTASVDQSFKHDVTPLKKYLGSQETDNACCKADSIQPADDSTKRERPSVLVLCHDGDEKEDRQTHQDRKSLTMACTPPEQPDGENMVYLAVDPDVNCKGPSLVWQEETRPDVASGSSFSVDSGPSGSSDGGGCAKPDDGQVEQYDLNLDLSLQTGSERVADIDLNLDLVLGFPQTNEYQPKHVPKDKTNDASNSLVLSLGMPCWT